MPNILLDHPSPDFEEFSRVIKGQQSPRRVHLVELGIDPEIFKAIQEGYLGEPWALPPGLYGPPKPDESYYRQVVNIYYRLGYDYVPLWPLWVNRPPRPVRPAKDTANLSRGSREWVDEAGGIIKSRADFENYPWGLIYSSTEVLEMCSRHLPSGMKLMVSACLFEDIFEELIGIEAFFYKLMDDPALVEDVFQRWGQVVFDFYTSVIDLDTVGGIFHADDIGYKTGTLISPAELRRLFFPWLAKYSALAHKHNKLFLLHCCGNIYKNMPSVMDDLIDIIKIDGLHSFQDVILPVADVRARFGDRVALLGGVDMDKLATLPEPELRPYIRDILGACMRAGRFALGSGNTIANYIPLENYAIMLDEARQWSCS